MANKLDQIRKMNYIQYLVEFHSDGHYFSTGKEIQFFAKITKRCHSCENSYHKLLMIKTQSLSMNVKIVILHLVSNPVKLPQMKLF